MGRAVVEERLSLESHLLKVMVILRLAVTVVKGTVLISAEPRKCTGPGVEVVPDIGHAG